MDELLFKKEEEKQLIFFNEALEYFNENMFIAQESNLINQNSNILREEMLNELENLKELLLNHPDIKYDSLSEEEKQNFQEFIRSYAICPICGSFNHYYNLKTLFFSENQDLLSDLVKLMKIKNKKFRNLNISFGIPCCNCFKLHLQRDE